jgi:hypothetical protein
MKTMMERSIALAFVALVTVGCDDPKSGPAASPSAQKQAAEADVAKSKAAADKAAADKAAEAAKAKAEEAAKNLEVAKDKAEEAGSDKLGPDESVWTKSWGAFHAGKDQTVDSGDWTIERGKDGTYSAWRKVKAAAAATAVKVEDAAVSAAVKTKLAADDDVKASKIDVDVKQNVVHLKGTVDKPEQAGEAMRIALGTGGVDKVISHLKWTASPGSTASPAATLAPTAAPAKK